MEGMHGGDDIKAEEGGASRIPPWVLVRVGVRYDNTSGQV